MDYLKINNLLYEYFLRDEEGNIEGIKTALDGINLSVKSGDFVAILGRNGSGKSTLAKLINALLIPADGTVIIDGKDTKDSENTLSIRMSNGMVFQNPDNQIVAGVVEEDVAFGPENLGIESEEIIKRVNNALSTMDMLAYKRKSPNLLSGGQKQRVAVAGVLAMLPKCIILDESTSMLDPKGRKEVISIAKKLNKEQNMTIILITHNMEEAVDCDHIFVMDTGKLVADGTPKEIFSDSEFLKSHGLCVPAITEIGDSLRKNGIPISSGILTRQELTLELERIYKSRGNNS